MSIGPEVQVAVETMARHWWVLALRGLLAIAFGILAIFWPLTTVLALAIVFAFYLVIDGLAEGYMGARERNGWWLAAGMAGVGVGILALIWPGLTAYVLLYLVAAWAIVRGVIEIVLAFRVNRAVGGGWMLGLAGATSTVFGVFAAVLPEAGMVAIVWLIGVYAIVFGILFVAAGLDIRSWGPTRRPTVA